MNKNTSVFVHIGDMLDRDYVIDFDVFLPSIGKNLQRPFVWTLFQKQQLILSILKGITIPKVSVVQYKDDIGPNPNRTITIKVIDGKQRINTILEFYQNKFPIEWEGNEYYFDDLDKWGKYEISSFTILGDVAYEYPDRRITDEDLIGWFEQINFSGTPQDIDHINSLKAK